MPWTSSKSSGVKDACRRPSVFSAHFKADEPIVSPVILLAEVASALGRGLGEEELAREVEMLAARAAESASEQKIRGCDAIYVALAQQLEM